MTLNLKDLSENVRKLNALLLAHIGGNNTAGIGHLVATDDQDGFLSANDKQMLDMKCRYATTVSNTGANVLSYNAGLYIGRSFSNAPSDVDDSLCLIDISGAGNGLYKKIEFVWISAGKRYFRYVYSSIDTGWFSSEWVSITPINGFSGAIQAKPIFTQNQKIIEVRINLKHSGLTSSAVTQIGVIPSSFGATGKTPYWVIPAQSGNTNCTANIVLTSGTALSVYRNETNSAGITSLYGSMMYSI